MTSPTTPRDAIGLSERLLAEIDQPIIYRNDAVLTEAAAALDALQARVKELEAEKASLFKSCHLAVTSRLEWRNCAMLTAASDREGRCPPPKEKL